MKRIVRIEAVGDPDFTAFVKREVRLFRVVSRKWFRFKSPWVWRIHFADGGCHEFAIPAGFETNGASIPFILRSIINALEVLFAACGHDQIYTSHEYSRRNADAIFRAAIIHLDERPAWVAWGCWGMVRCFAFLNYRAA